MLCAVLCHSQSFTGITNKKDTSFSTYSAYAAAIKTHPDIKIVGELKTPIGCTKEKHNLLQHWPPPIKTGCILPKKEKHRHCCYYYIWRRLALGQHGTILPLSPKTGCIGLCLFYAGVQALNQSAFPAGIYDIKAAIRWVRKNTTVYNIDMARIVAPGFSAGGEMAAFMGTTGNMPLFNGTRLQHRYQRSCKCSGGY